MTAVPQESFAQTFGDRFQLARPSLRRLESAVLRRSRRDRQASETFLSRTAC